MNFDDYPLDAHTCQFQVGSCKLSVQSNAVYIKSSLKPDKGILSGLQGMIFRKSWQYILVE